MPGKFVVSLMHAKDDRDRATLVFVVANAAVASDKETVVFISTKTTRLSQKGYANDIHERASRGSLS
jgi:predicted peroxiredoxin